MLPDKVFGVGVALLLLEYDSEPRRRVSEIAGDADKIALACHVAAPLPALRAFSEYGDADAQSTGGGCRVAAEKRTAELQRKVAVAADELLHPGVVNLVRDCQGEECRRRGSSHGRDVADVDGGGFPAEAVRADVVQQEVAAFDQHVGADESGNAVSLRDDGAVVSYAHCSRVAVYAVSAFLFRAVLPVPESVPDLSDQSEFSYVLEGHILCFRP